MAHVWNLKRWVENWVKLARDMSSKFEGKMKMKWGEGINEQWISWETI